MNKSQLIKGLKTLSLILLLSSFKFEAARSPNELAQGYMYRESIDPDEMMLFILPYEQHFSLWMHNVNFNLDAAFLDNQMNILEIVHMKAYPQQRDPRFFFDKVVKSKNVVKYALEASEGFFERNHLKVGDHVRFLIPGNILREERIFQNHNP